MVELKCWILERNIGCFQLQSKSHICSKSFTASPSHSHTLSHTHSLHAQPCHSDVTMSSSFPSRKNIRIALLRRQSRDVVSSSDVCQAGQRISQLQVDKQAFIKSKAAIFGTGITQQSAAKSDIHIPTVGGREAPCVCYEIKFEVTREDWFCILSSSLCSSSRTHNRKCVCLCSMVIANEVLHSLQWNLQEGGFR